MASLTEEEARAEADEDPASRPRGPAAGPGFVSRMAAATGRLLTAFRGFLVRGRFSSLTRRIVVFNVAALFVLVSGILYLNQFREGLIDARRQSLLTQAEIIAGAIEEGATTSPDAPLIDPLAAGAIIAPPPDDTASSGIDETLPIDPETAAPIL
ncbi:MAG: sensor N-terminal transmembrane domain-containing protein, partial [Parvibaculum sp.]